MLKCFKLIKNFVIIVFKKKELVKYESDDILSTNIDSKQEQTFYKGYKWTNYINAWSYQMQQATHHVK